MIEKSLSIMIFMWAVSFSVFGFQVALADAFGIEITNYRGEAIRPQLARLIDTESFNSATEAIVSGTYTDANGTEHNRITDAGISSIFIVWELIQLLSGTYIFGFLYLLGVPLIFVTILVIIYFALLARAIVGYIRGS